MAALRTVRFPSQLKRYPVLTIHLSVTRSPERSRLWANLKATARSRGETTTKLILRAISREVARLKAEIENGPLAVRLAQQDRDEAKVVEMLPEDVRKKYGL